MKTMIYGANGKMGQIIGKLLEHNSDFDVVAGVDRSPSKFANRYPVYTKPDEFKGEVDLIIDFSHPCNIETLVNYATDNQIALVIATTGLNSQAIDLLKEKSKIIPILYSSNMSLGINIVKGILKAFSKTLDDHFDIEIIEKHHKKKLDAPSGTAYLIADTINEALGCDKHFLYGRNGEKLREENQIGIHAIRGGTITGEHSVLFAGEEEVIEIKHAALSKDIFGIGAIKAGEFVVKQPPGFYTMDAIFKF